MRITEETATKLVVKKTPRYVGLIMIGAGVILAFFALALFAATDGKTSNAGRAPTGAVVFVFPVGGLIFLLIDWRQNRKTLIMDSDAQTATVIDLQTYKIPYAQINGFGLRRASMSHSVIIDLELKNGQRFSTGIDSHRGRDEDVPVILQKLTAKLKPPPQTR